MNLDNIISIRDAYEQVKHLISYSTFYRLANTSGVPIYRIGKKMFIEKSANYIDKIIGPIAG